MDAHAICSRRGMLRCRCNGKRFGKERETEREARVTHFQSSLQPLDFGSSFIWTADAHTGWTRELRACGQQADERGSMQRMQARNRK